jgi:uncharacterized membrane protein YphA (DoxX/SURF4 family)
MGLIHRLARVLLSGIFISAGVDVLRNPEPRAVIATPFLERIRALAPALPSDPVLVVRANAAFQIVAGATLAVGILPRLSALALAGSLVPTTLGAHRSGWGPGIGPMGPGKGGGRGMPWSQGTPGTQASPAPTATTN